VQERRLATLPKTPAFRSDLARSEKTLADLLLERKNTTEARKTLENAIRHGREALDASRDPADGRLVCACSVALIELLLDQGNHGEASKVVRELLVAVPPQRNTPGIIAPERAAAFLARCVALVDRDEKLSEPKRAECRQVYGDSAMRLLRRAINQGYKEPKVLKASVEFAAVRSREDFQQLLRQLETPKEN
jgi:hypothetical protein